MGLLHCHLPCKFCHNHKESQTDQSHDSINELHSESSSTSASLSSQPSLPSVPSLTSQHSLTFRTVRHQCVATLRNSSGSSSVSSLTLHGKLLYGGYSDSKILAWNCDSLISSSKHESFAVVAASQGAVKSMIAVNNLLFSAHQDYKIRVWKIKDKINDKDCGYDLIATLPTVQDRFLRCFSEKNYVQVRRHKKCTWVHHVDTVSALAISNDNSLLYTASWDRSFKIWRTKDFKCLESVGNAHDDAINSIALSKEGFVYTGSADKKIKVWKRHVGEKKHSLVDTLEKHKSAVNALALSSDGCVLYSGACDRSILVWEKHSAESGDAHMMLAGALRGHSKAILCIAIVNDLVCSGSADNTVRVWRGRGEMKYSSIAVLEGHKKPVKCVSAAVDSSDREGGAFGSSSTSCYVYSGSLDGDIRIWNVVIPGISTTV